MPDPHGTFVVALPSDTNLCAVHARWANTVTTEQLFTKLVARAPTPLLSKLRRNEYVETDLNGLTHTLSFEWYDPNTARKMLFMLTTAASSQAHLQVLGTASLRDGREPLTTEELDTALGYYFQQYYHVDGVARHCLAILGRTESPQDYVEAWQQRNRKYVAAADQYLNRRLEDMSAEAGPDRAEDFRNTLTSTAQSKAQGTIQIVYAFVGGKTLGCKPMVSLVDAGEHDIKPTSPSFYEFEPLARWAASQDAKPSPTEHP